VPRFRVRFQNQDLELPPGEFVVGRSGECQLALDDPLVSRRHASFFATEQRLTVEDLGSRNGVKVNGNRINGRVELSQGDIVGIGGSDLHVQVLEGDADRPKRSHAVTMTSEVPDGGNAIGLLSGLVDKALAMGRVDEAERILTNLLSDVLLRLQRGGNPQGLPDATRYALRLASETGKTNWIDWVFQAHHAAGKILPMQTVDELYSLVRKVRYPVTPALRTYVDGLRPMADKLSPTERFALQRIEGLVRVLLA
jgi:pSer/pThr/pTyr-binding forkhead associated (FHA) protein